MGDVCQCRRHCRAPSPELLHQLRQHSASVDLRQQQNDTMHEFLRPSHRHGNFHQGSETVFDVHAAIHVEYQRAAELRLVLLVCWEWFLFLQWMD